MQAIAMCRFRGLPTVRDGCVDHCAALDVDFCGHMSAFLGFFVVCLAVARQVSGMISRKEGRSRYRGSIAGPLSNVLRRACAERRLLRVTVARKVPQTSCVRQG